MSEDLKTKETFLPKFEELELPAHATPDKAPEKQTQLSADKAREAVAATTQHESQPNPLEQLKQAERAPEPVSTTNVNRELKQITLRRELKQIRRKLSAPQRALSQVIHQPIVRVTSEAVGKTLTRPSGMLGGGLVALSGTSIYLFLANHIGFSYNYGVFLALFAGGFVLGLLLELVVNLAFSSRRRSHD